MGEQNQPKKEDAGAPLKQIHFCNQCKLEIAEGAKKCHHCGSGQNGWSRFIQIAPVFMIGVAIVQVILGFGQLVLGRSLLLETKRERVLASNALKRAEQAEYTAISVAKNLDKIQVKVEGQAKTINLITTKVEAQAKTIDVITDRVKQKYKEMLHIGGKATIGVEESGEHAGAKD